MLNISRGIDNMNCPKCGKEMEDGYLYSPHRLGPVFYQPKRLKLPWPGWFIKPKRFRESGCINIESGYQDLPLNYSFRGHRAVAYICKECRTGIFEYDEDKTVSTERP